MKRQLRLLVFDTKKVSPSFTAQHLAERVRANGESGGGGGGGGGEGDDGCRVQLCEEGHHALVTSNRFWLVINDAQTYR